jgi:hypothetical protein
MTHPDDPASPSESPAPELPPGDGTAAPLANGEEAPLAHHPPFARSPDDYTDPPGHHRRGPHGPALDVGA